MKTQYTLVFVLTLSVVSHHASASPGGLDPSFGGTGKITTIFGAPSSANAIAVQSDGKIVVVGGTGNTGEFRDEAIVVRYNTAGVLDSTFNGSGKVVGRFGANVLNNTFYSVVVQPDGKVVAAGAAMVNEAGFPRDDFLAVRRNVAGSADQQGVYERLGGTDRCHSMVLQPGGKIILAGFVGNPGVSDFGLLRLNPDFGVDTSFQGGQSLPGWVNTNFTTPFVDDQANSVAVQNDGKIVAAGYTAEPGNGKFALARYNSDGSLDTTFNGTGKVMTGVGNFPEGGTQGGGVTS